MAPEIHSNWQVSKRDGFVGVPYDTLAECYSLAVVVWECVSQEVPYQHNTVEATLGLADRIAQGLRPDTSNLLMCRGFPVEFLERGWHQDPHERPTAAVLRDQIKSEISQELEETTGRREDELAFLLR